MTPHLVSDTPSLRPRLLVLALGNFAVGTGALVLAGVLPYIARDMTVSPSVAGYTVTVYALVYLSLIHI